MKTKYKSYKTCAPGVELNYLTIRECLGGGKVLASCRCGTTKTYWWGNLQPRHGNRRYTHSCGCQKSALVREKNTVHGLAGTKFYRHWRSMFDRTSARYVNATAYTGVVVCKRWHNFEHFKSDMFESWTQHERAHGGRNTTLDRIDVAKGYCKGNCRWSTQKEQACNKKNTLRVVYRDKELSVRDLAEQSGILYVTLRARLMRGWTVEQAVNTPKWIGVARKTKEL